MSQSVTIWRNINVVPYFGHDNETYLWSQILIHQVGTHQPITFLQPPIPLLLIVCGFFCDLCIQQNIENKSVDTANCRRTGWPSWPLLLHPSSNPLCQETGSTSSPPRQEASPLPGPAHCSLAAASCSRAPEAPPEPLKLVASPWSSSRALKLLPAPAAAPEPLPIVKP